MRGSGSFVRLIILFHLNYAFLFRLGSLDPVMEGEDLLRAS